MKKITLLEFAVVLMMLVSLSACKKVFDIQPEDQLDEANAYQNVYDADAAVIGIYGKFMGLAEQYVVLNELRADLLDVTANSNEALRQINTHTVTENNPYASPKPFYELILNCNDVLAHFKVMVQDKKMNEEQFNQRYSDIAALRSFLYLQLGIHFGDVPYVTSTLKNVDEVKNAANFKRIPFNALLDSLISNTETIPFKEIYPSGSGLNITVDGYQTQKFYINKKVLLGDLYLWKGNYQKAADYYRQVMEYGTTAFGFGEDFYSYYKLGWAGGHNHYVSYGRAGDASTLTYNDGWRVIFESAYGSNSLNREWVWVLPFDNKFKPENSLIKLFSPIGGQYLVRPSQEVYDLWDGETQRPAQGTSIPYDARKLLSTMNIGGQPVAMKYLYNYINWATGTAATPLIKNGKWFLFRQTHLHMRYAEAANRLGKHRIAWALVSGGFAAAYPAPTSDVTNYHNTLAEPYPFNFDARNSGNSGVPYYRADWYRQIGIRARALVTDWQISSDSLNTIEAGIIKEGALENAFEGTRWPDLLRVALRKNDPAFVADKVYNKLVKSGISAGAASAARAKLMARDWYLPFKW
ncbi:putative outer membrane starch-binding protein [Lacibacter cauensis]|uniref:Putative outer membrane starch-binding protein n=1 Tax=Lacibacter cauensis TaxID=510947 RepID=A0A562SWG2_9BACT|nr:RagB/SusD family nutrient uptake outer membrane protein [Lacibacter cauensis]TWI85629.1 putative outer membrane starch-binding protein [Lacibacter cauensis]